MQTADLFAASLAYDRYRRTLDAARATMARADATDPEHAAALAVENRCLHELAALEPLHHRYLDEQDERREVRE